MLSTEKFYFSLPRCLACGILLLLTACQPSAAPKTGDVAPAISCNDIAGEYFNLGGLKGRVVVIYFWSSKCCGDSLKRVEPFYAKKKHQGLSLVAVEVGGTKESVASFVAGNELSFTNLADDYSMISKSYRVVGFPTIFIVDKNGMIRRKVSGEIQAEQLTKIADQYL